MLVSFKASNVCIAQYEVDLLPKINETVIIKNEKYKVTEIVHKFNEEDENTSQAITIILLKQSVSKFNYKGEAFNHINCKGESYYEF